MRPPQHSLLVLAAAGLAVLATAASAQPISKARLLVFSAAAEDPRIVMTLDAVDFWNRTFDELHLEPVLVTTEVVDASPLLHTLETYARIISQRAGRVAPGDFEPPAPPEVAALEADLVLLLSRQNLMPFAWPLPESSTVFIAINGDPAISDATPKTTRNVIAHELGHALGLEHQADPTALMCLPCRPSPPSARGSAFLPLTAQDRTRLVELYATAGD